MVSMKSIYKGDKHCENIHGPSACMIETDAPKDNAGRGEAFSPTDLVGTALASCILTTMAISAERDGLDIRGATADVTKEMQTNPRRIHKLPVSVHLPQKLRPEERKKLEMMARGCPVHHSLHPEIESPITFYYDLN